MDTKRLLCIIGSMNAGGAETFMMKIYRQLDKSMYQIDFAVAVEEKMFYEDEIIAMGGKIYRISPKSKGFFKNFGEIKDIVRKNGYKYVLRVSQHSLSAFELLAAGIGGAKTRVFRSSNSNTTTGGGRDLMLHKICGFMPKLFANVRIAPSTEAAEFMFGKNCVAKNRAHLLHNAIDTGVFRYDAARRDEIRAELGLNGCLTVGHVGRFNQQKNHSFLIDIFMKLHEKRDDTKLLLVGTGELEGEIKEKIAALGLEKNVVFAGVRSDVPDLLSAMDVFVFPSLYEGMPNTVIEAQATGLPCCIADTITPEADITGLVKYLPLTASAQSWAQCALDSVSDTRKNTKKEFIEAGYNIESAAEYFVKLCYNSVQ